MKKENFLYYMAGFIDGEGTITLSVKKSKTGNTQFRVPVISASSTTLEILNMLQYHYGGHILVTPRNGRYTPQQMENKLKFQETFFHPSKS